MDSPMIERGKGMDGANPLDPFSWAAAEAKMSQKWKRKKEMIDLKSFPISRLGQTQRRAQQQRRGKRLRYIPPAALY